ncbi:SPOR domain-containing protein [Halofilum ochraceum]|uniref:SPOR domain-containing protein n=1 Tax=Halofilum ochraceum TaxID=1611323 RepID=UPI0008D9BDE6|nr:SPOR domain-containing protein [Halofilum ochraceum]
MDSGLKQRLVGAVVLVALAVIFLPMLLDGSGARERLNEDIAIPEQPEAPESRLQQNGSGSQSGAGDDVDATTATLATDDFSGAADSGADAGEQVDTEPERETEPQAGADAPAPEEESGSDQGSTAADAADNADADPAPSSGWVVQVGSFQRETNAIVLRDRLREDGFDANVEQVTGDNGTLWRVWLGPVGEREAGEALERRIEDHRGSDALLMEYSE